MFKQNLIDSYYLYCKNPKGRYIYFITPDDEEDTVKIGMSKDPFSRKRELQVGNSKLLKLKLFFGPWALKDAKNIEKEIHQKLIKNKLRGEWYNINYRVAWRFFDTKEMTYFDGVNYA